MPQSLCTQRTSYRNPGFSTLKVSALVNFKLKYRNKFNYKHAWKNRIDYIEARTVLSKPSLPSTIVKAKLNILRALHPWNRISLI